MLYSICSIRISRDGMDGVYLEAWLLANTSGYKRKGDLLYTRLSPEQIYFLRNEGWSVWTL